MTKTEGNEIIAKWLGWFKEEGQPDTWYVKTDTAIVVACSTYKDPFKELPFHKDWNRLIPVVKKLTQDLWVTQNWAMLQEYSSIKRALQSLDIEKLWLATVEAIQLINKYTEDAIHGTETE